MQFNAEHALTPRSRIIPALAVALASGALAIPALAQGAEVDEPPIATIVGGLTQVGAPHSLSIDAQGRIYSAQQHGGVNIYPWTANGNIAPSGGVVTPPGGSPASTPLATHIDSDGALWVGYNSARILKFPAGATTGTAPTGSLNVQEDGGDNVRGLDRDAQGNVVASSVDRGWLGTFAPPASALLNPPLATPIRRIAGPLTTLGPTSGLAGMAGIGQSWGFAIDGAGNRVIAVHSRVLRFAPTADGDVAPTGAIDPPGGFHTAIGIAIAPSGNVYVAERSGGVGGYGSGAISIFPPTALNSSSDVDTPIKRIVGASTGLAGPVDLDLAPSSTPGGGSGTIVVANSSAGITKYAAIEAGGTPGSTDPAPAPAPDTPQAGEPAASPTEAAQPAGADRPRTGVSINCGATFTDSPEVTICVNPPPGAVQMALSNDGGFDGARTVPVAARIPWTLDDSGPVRLPKTIYARFDGPGVNSETPYTDEIILDTGKPEVTDAVLTVDGVQEMARARRTTLLRVDARDNLSSVSRMRIAVGGTALRFRAFQRTVRIGGAHGNVKVRVRDRAGNWSEWRPATLSTP